MGRCRTQRLDGSGATEPVWVSARLRFSLRFDVRMTTQSVCQQATRRERPAVLAPAHGKVPQGFAPPCLLWDEQLTAHLKVLERALQQYQRLRGPSYGAAFFVCAGLCANTSAGRHPAHMGIIGPGAGSAQGFAVAPFPSWSPSSSMSWAHRHHHHYCCHQHHNYHKQVAYDK